MYHTNHPLVNDDVKKWFEKFSPSFNEKPLNTNSHIRLAAVQTRVSESSGIDDTLIKETLRSKDDEKNPVCRSVTGSGGAFTFGSVIMTLSGKPFLQITAGSPDDSEYKRVDFTNK